MEEVIEREEGLVELWFECKVVEEDVVDGICVMVRLETEVGL